MAKFMTNKAAAMAMVKSFTKPGENPTPPVNREKLYEASARLQHYKERLNNELRRRDPKGFQNLFDSLLGARRLNPTANVTPVIEQNPYNKYLTPDDVKAVLGDDYGDYVDAVKTLKSNWDNASRKRLFGDIEGDQPVEAMNYGKRFATMPLITGVTDKGQETQWVYDSKAKKVVKTVNKKS